jgi:hypothetical protein
MQQQPERDEDPRDDERVAGGARRTRLAKERRARY